MFPLQAVVHVLAGRFKREGVGWVDGGEEAHTKLLLDGLENLFLVEFLWKTLDGGQRFATITLCQGRVSS